MQVVITLMTSQKVPTYHFQCQRISENNENLAVHGNYNYHDTGFLYKKLKETLSKIILEHRNILGVKKDHCPILSENCLIRTYIPHLHEEIIHLINVAWKWSFSHMHKRLFKPDCTATRPDRNLQISQDLQVIYTKMEDYEQTDLSCPCSHLPYDLFACDAEHLYFKHHTIYTERNN